MDLDDFPFDKFCRKPPNTVTLIKEVIRYLFNDAEWEQKYTYQRDGHHEVFVIFRRIMSIYIEMNVMVDKDLLTDDLIDLYTNEHQNLIVEFDIHHIDEHTFKTITMEFDTDGKFLEEKRCEF